MFIFIACVDCLNFLCTTINTINTRYQRKYLEREYLKWQKCICKFCILSGMAASKFCNVSASRIKFGIEKKSLRTCKVNFQMEIFFAFVYVNIKG